MLIGPGQGDALWAWKSFVRGHNPILMDYGLLGGFEPGDDAEGGEPTPFDAFEPPLPEAADVTSNRPWWLKALEAVAALLAASITLLLFTGVVSRYLFAHPIVWLDELVSLQSYSAKNLRKGVEDLKSVIANAKVSVAKKEEKKKEDK